MGEFCRILQKGKGPFQREKKQNNMLKRCSKKGAGFLTLCEIAAWKRLLKYVTNYSFIQKKITGKSIDSTCMHQYNEANYERKK